MPQSVYNTRCADCPHSEFHHMRPDIKIDLAFGKNISEADKVPGACTECGCAQFKPRPAVAPVGSRGVSLRPSSSRNDISAARALRKLREMMDDPDEIWAFAMDTINSLYEGIERSGTCSDAQLTAIDNIYEGGLRGSGRSRPGGRWDE